MKPLLTVKSFKEMQEEAAPWSHLPLREVLYSTPGCERFFSKPGVVLINENGRFNRKYMILTFEGIFKAVLKNQEFVPSDPIHPRKLHPWVEISWEEERGLPGDGMWAKETMYDRGPDSSLNCLAKVQYEHPIFDEFMMSRLLRIFTWRWDYAEGNPCEDRVGVVHNMLQKFIIAGMHEAVQKEMSLYARAGVFTL